MLRLLTLAVVATLCLPLAALAQDVDPIATLDALPILLDALSRGPAGVGLAVAAGILLLVQLLRTFGARIHPVLGDGRVAVALALLLPVVGTIVTVLHAGGALTLAVIVNALLAGLTASGLFSAARTLAPNATAKASAAGDAAAAHIGGKAAAQAAIREAGK